MICVWTGTSSIKIAGTHCAVWTPVELDVDAAKWLVKRSMHVRPLLSVAQAAELISGASEATVTYVAAQCRLSGDLESLRTQILARLGVVKDAEPELTVAEIKSLLDEAGVVYTTRATKADLLDLLESVK